MVHDESSNTSKSSSSTANSSRKDPAWQYCFCPNSNDATTVTCTFCGKTSKGGIFRQKEHLIGGSRNVEACKKCPENVRKELQIYVNSKKMAKGIVFGAVQDLEDLQYGDDEMDDEIEAFDEPANCKGKRARTESEGGSWKIKKSFLSKSQIGLMFMRQEDKGVKVRLEQPNIKDTCDKELRGRCIQDIARFFYTAGLLFNVIQMESFKTMVESIGRYGPRLTPPSYHELRVPLLKKEVAYTKDLMKGHMEEWAKHGCSIMSDAWTDQKQRTIINFLVNCSLGTMFVKSVDAYAYVKTGEKLFELLDRFVEEIGEENVVQVITDNGSNYVLAGKLLMLKRPHLYWTPCAAHCLDLILEDIGKIEKVKKILSKAISLVGYIYNHTGVLNLMREHTKKRELVRHGVTCFATTFLTLQSVYKQKTSLRSMFTSEQWVQSKWLKDAKAKRVVEVVFQVSFWKNVVYTLKVMGPLVRVLRLADNEKKPTMGYMYEAMDRAKETIQNAFSNNESMYKSIFEIIDKRWACQLHQSLHATGHYLNPGHFYFDPSIKNCKELVEGLMKCVSRLVPNMEVQDKIMEELEIYKRSQEIFGHPMAIRSRKKKSPVHWWSTYGCSAPNLQQLAIRILSLTCSASGCERNWSIFEHIHSKKRNRLEHQRLQDLVYVKYNQTLKNRFDRKDLVDPISLHEIDDSNEWLVGEMEEDERVFENEDLTWDVVQQASGADEPRVCTRQGARGSLQGSNTSSAQETNTSTSRQGANTRRSANAILGYLPLIEEEFGDDADTEEEEDIGGCTFDEDVDFDENLFDDCDDPLED